MEVYEECDGQLISELKDQNVTMIQDGWSNVHNHPVIGHPLTGWLHTFDHDAITFQLLQHAYIMGTKLPLYEQMIQVQQKNYRVLHKFSRKGNRLVRRKV